MKNYICCFRDANRVLYETDHNDIIVDTPLMTKLLRLFERWFINVGIGTPPYKVIFSEPLQTQIFIYDHENQTWKRNFP